MKILGILPHSIGGRLTISSILDGFTQNECEVTIFDELKQTNFSEMFENQNFDYMVGYDFSAIKLKSDYDLKIKTINYFSDEIESRASGVGTEWEKYLPFLNEEDNYTFYWDRALAIKSDIKNLHYMPHFVNTDIYKDLELVKDYDIMFAGRLDTDYRLNFFVELIQQFPNLKFAWYAIKRHYIDAISRTDEKQLLGSAYRGFIDNETDMAEALNKSKIVINMNSQGQSSLNYRTMQSIACKTLLISDFREEIDMFSGNLPFYINFGDLVEKINYYLNNEKAYQYTTNKCFDIVSKHLNSKVCVKQIIDVINN